LMNALNRAIRELLLAKRSFLAKIKGGDGPELIPFVVNLPADVVPPWMRLEEVQAAICDAAADTVARLTRGQLVTPGQLLARKNVPAELRSRAARSMLAMRGGRATAAKMRPLGYPNLVKAREALSRKAKG